jgi:murein tripeptide amidase MpaA
MKLTTVGLLTMTTITSIALADVPLPPIAQWHGASEQLLEDVPDEWRTPAEKSDFRTTPDYATTLAFIERLDRASPLISVREIGRSSEGRSLVAVIATRETRHDFDSLRQSKRARVLAQAGIHAGEIDGKDAGLMLLRDLVLGRRADILEHATLVFVPVLSPDGHERANGTRRMNQRGPDNAGWRTTARNLNLNRDWAKLDAPETLALVGLINAVDPDLFVDLHVTDGADHQYDVTFAFNEDVAAWSPAIARWLTKEFRPSLDRALTAGGHRPGEFMLEHDARNPAAGLDDPHASARFSAGYGDLRHLPSVLVENHSLKPYRRRVLGTYLFVEHALRTAGRDVESLRAAIAADRSHRAASLPVDYATGKTPSRQRNFLGIGYEHFESPISGQRELRFLGTPVTYRVDVYTDSPTLSIARPAAYWIPPSRSDVVAKLRAHGVRVEEIAAPGVRKLTFYRLREPKLAPAAAEGHVAVKLAGVDTEVIERAWPARSYRVPTDQPLGDLAMVLLEPQSPDSYFAWGCVLEPLQRTEYAEAYIMEPLAQQMLAKDAKLRAEWQKALSDPAFAKDAEARLDWFYSRSGLYDEQYLLYPIARE